MSSFPNLPSSKALSPPSHEAIANVKVTAVSSPPLSSNRPVLNRSKQHYASRIPQQDD